jgi:hypothetical protein
LRNIPTCVLSATNQIVEKEPYTAYLIQRLDAIGKELDYWEQEFLVSVTHQFFDDNKEMSTKQLLRLEQICKRYYWYHRV